MILKNTIGLSEPQFLCHGDRDYIVGLRHEKLFFNGAVDISSLLVHLAKEKEGSGGSGNQMLNPRSHTHYFCL